MASEQFSDGRAHQGPSGQGSDESQALWGEIKDGIDLVKAGVDTYKAVTAGPSSASDTFQIVILDSCPSTTRDGESRLLVLVRVHNTSQHSVYIERVFLEQRQRREGSPFADAQYRISRVGREKFGLDSRTEPLEWQPIRVNYLEYCYIQIEIEMAPKTWPARDRFGVVAFSITKLQDEGGSERRMSFAIRR